jgi:uncharacterized protein HemX
MRLTAISQRSDKMKKGLIAVGVAILLGVGFAVVVAQKKPVTYKPNDLQQAHLELLQTKALLAQRDLQVVQQRFQDSLNALNAEAEKIKKENKWSPDVKFSPDTLTFDMPKLTPLPSPAPAPAKKP